MRSADIIATIQFYSTEAGGRRGSTPATIFKCPLEFEGEKFDCGLHLKDSGPLAPGAKATVPITFLYPELIKSRLKAGSRFTLWEMRTIAEGIVDEIVPSAGSGEQKCH